MPFVVSTLFSSLLVPARLYRDLEEAEVVFHCVLNEGFNVLLDKPVFNALKYDQRLPCKPLLVD